MLAGLVENELSLRLHGEDAQVMSAPVMNLPLEIAGRRFQSRLMAGTGKFASNAADARYAGIMW